MKFLRDENLSDRLLAQLVDLFPGSSHVKHEGLSQTDDVRVWDAARDRGFVVLTRDKDFQQLGVLRGSPPKVVWVRIGNRTTRDVARLIRSRAGTIEAFARDDRLSLLVLVPDVGE